MPVLKIKKTDGTWQEVWGGLNSNPVSLPRLVTITIPVSGWSGSNNMYSQVISVNGVNANSKLDLQPTSSQIAALKNAEIVLMASNNNGKVTIYSVNGKPSTNLTMQMLITDVEVIS